MAGELHGRRVAILATDGVERVELEQPRSALHDAAAQTDLLSLHGGEIQARNNDLDPAGTFGVDGLVADASVDDYDALLLPGGRVNPDRLRMDRAAVGFVRDFVGSGKPVAAICHGPWTLLEAGVVRGRTITSFPSLRTDLRNAGANVVDQRWPGMAPSSPAARRRTCPRSARRSSSCSPGRPRAPGTARAPHPDPRLPGVTARRAGRRSPAGRSQLIAAPRRRMLADRGVPLAPAWRATRRPARPRTAPSRKPG